MIEIERQLAQDVSQLPDEERKTRMQAAEQSLLEQKRDYDAKAAALDLFARLFLAVRKRNGGVCE